MVAILISKSLPPSYDTYVSSFFAGTRDLGQAHPFLQQTRFLRNKCAKELSHRMPTLLIISTPEMVAEMSIFLTTVIYRATKMKESSQDK